MVLINFFFPQSSTKMMIYCTVITIMLYTRQKVCPVSCLIRWPTCFGGTSSPRPLSSWTQCWWLWGKSMTRSPSCMSSIMPPCSTSGGGRSCSSLEECVSDVSSVLCPDCLTSLYSQDWQFSLNDDHCNDITIASLLCKLFTCLYVQVARVCLFVGCLASQQHASVSQERICSDNLCAATLR